MEQTVPVTFHHLFGDIEDLIQKSGNDSPKLIPATSSIFEYGINLYRQEKLIGQIGKIVPKISQYFDIKYDVFYGEIDWNHLVKKADNTVSFEKISKYPEVRRDLSLIIKKNVTYDKIKEIAQSTEKKLLSKINVFNIYEGDKIGNENKAYAIAFYLQDQEKTLNDKQIDKIMSKLIYRFENELNAVIRK
jgi:phenylalanyl-tRNA synthetase beta chain